MIISRKKFKGKIEASIYRALMMDSKKIQNLEDEMARRMAKKIADGLWQRILCRERFVMVGLIIGFFVIHFVIH